MDENYSFLIFFGIIVNFATPAISIVVLGKLSAKIVCVGKIVFGMVARRCFIGFFVKCGIVRVVKPVGQEFAPTSFFAFGWIRFHPIDRLDDFNFQINFWIDHAPLSKIFFCDSDEFKSFKIKIKIIIRCAKPRSGLSIFFSSSFLFFLIPSCLSLLVRRSVVARSSFRSSIVSEFMS